MHIVFVAHFAGAPQYGMVYGHYYLAREWVRAGHQVTIVASGFAHTRFCQPDVGGNITEEYVDGIRYLWVKTPKYSPEDRFGRVRNIVSFVVQVSFRSLPIINADIVICSSHYPFAIHPSQRLAKRFNAQLIFEVRDLWPLTLIELGGAGVRNPFIVAMQWSEDYAYRHANLVVSVLVAAKNYMVSRGMNPDKFTFIPNGVNMDEICQREKLPSGHIECIENAKKRGSFLVGYAGRVGLANALHTLLEALSLIDKNDADVTVAILGDGSHVEVLQEQSKRLGVSDRVLFLKSVCKAQVNDFLARMDALYIGLQSQPLFRFGVSPTKLNDYMLASKPIIYAIDAPGNVVSESGAGLSCRAENPKDTSEALLQLTRMTEGQRSDMGGRGYRWIVANRDYRVLAERFLSDVRSTLQKKF